MRKSSPAQSKAGSAITLLPPELVTSRAYGSMRQSCVRLGVQDELVLVAGLAPRHVRRPVAAPSCASGSAAALQPLNRRRRRPPGRAAPQTRKRRRPRAARRPSRPGARPRRGCRVRGIAVAGVGVGIVLDGGGIGLAHGPSVVRGRDGGDDEGRAAGGDHPWRERGFAANPTPALAAITRSRMRISPPAHRHGGLSDFHLAGRIRPAAR